MDIWAPAKEKWQGFLYFKRNRIWGKKTDCMSQATYGKQVAKMSSEIRGDIPLKQRSCFF